MEEKVISLENIIKTFPGVRALDDVSFNLYKGEVHILLGENGAGKSTLMKILAGVFKADSGKIIIKNEELVFLNPHQAQEKHIAIIYQEFNLLPNLTVAQNVFIGREPLKKNHLIDKKTMIEDAERILKFLNANIDPKVLVSSLGVAQQQLVEVAKAIAVKSEILIMDEPTATLSAREIEQLFVTIRDLQSKGVSIIYISHRLQEVKQIGSRVTVLRDGQSVGTRQVEETELDELITMMVGRDIRNERIRKINTASDEECLRIENLTQGKKLKNINMYIKKGEIVGLAGLVGAGRTELANAIYGIDKFDNGKIILFGKTMTKTSPEICINNGVGFIPENRKDDGLAVGMTIKNNVVQASLKTLFPKGYINDSVETKVAAKHCEELRVNTKDMDLLTQSLSGGNQQKVVLAKWICTHSDFIIFDEPTRGIDVGAKDEIHSLMISLAETGVGILMISSDLPEIMSLSDRIYVMKEGEIVEELIGENTSQEEVIGYAAGRWGANEQN